METLVDDIGSFPLPADTGRDNYGKAYELAREAILQGKDISKDDFLQRHFCDVVLGSFRIKLNSGLDIANFPQHYDGIKQVGDALHTAMENGSFLVEEKKTVFPEVHLIKQNAKALSQEFGKKILLRVSIFGPIELYLHEVGKIPYPDVLDGMAETIRRFAKSTVLNTKYIQTSAVSIDEPSLGINNIQASNELVCEVLEKAFDFQGTTRQIHLHSAAGLHDLLSIKNLDVLSFEFAASPKNIEAVPKNILEKADKQIRVGISRTDIDSILAELYEKDSTKPSAAQMVEPIETIRKRYRVAKEKYGDRMTFTGPDCGLGGWPSQDAATLLLKRTVEAVKTA